MNPLLRRSAFVGADLSAKLAMKIESAPTSHRFAPLAALGV